MRFENPARLTREAAAIALESGDGQRIATCLVALALHEPDTELVWLAIRTHVDNEDVDARGIAILCIGHMARIHGWIPSDWAEARVALALKDPDAWVRGHAISATDDIGIFKPRRSKPA